MQNNIIKKEEFGAGEMTQSLKIITFSAKRPMFGSQNPDQITDNNLYTPAPGTPMYLTSGTFIHMHTTTFTCTDTLLRVIKINSEKEF